MLHYPEYPRYKISLPNGELNESSFCKLAGYHELICAAAEYELERCGQSVTDTIKDGFAWALTSITLDVYIPVDNCYELCCQTWISPAPAPYSRREVSAEGSDGRTRFDASLFFVPLNIADRHIDRTVPLYDCERFNAGEALIKDAVHKHTEPKDYADTYPRAVMPSDIDALGHMNNCRYGALVYDAITRDERTVFSKPFRYIIDFRRQLTEGSAVTVAKCAENGAIYVKGTAESGRVSFSASVRPL